MPTITNPNFLGLENMIEGANRLHFANLYGDNVQSTFQDSADFEIVTFDRDLTLRQNSDQITTPDHKQLLFTHTGIFNVIQFIFSCTTRIPTNMSAQTGNIYLYLYRRVLENGEPIENQRTVMRVRNQAMEENKYKSIALTAAWGNDIPKKEGITYEYRIAKQGFIEISDPSFSMIGLSITG